MMTKGPKISSQMWLARQKRDVYVKQRDVQGWAARSAFKLMEMDDKLKWLRGGCKVLDLGAAPGGWSQVALRKGARVVSCDLLPHNIPQGDPDLGRLCWVQGDFTDARVQQIISTHEAHFNVILSDMAPNYSGVDDHIRLIGLAETAFRFAVDEGHLAIGGHFLCKISRGGEEQSFRKVVSSAFAKVTFEKPPASRSNSTEVYLVAQNFKGVKQQY